MKIKFFKVFVYGKRMKDNYVGASKWQVIKYYLAIRLRQVFMIAAGVISVVLISMTWVSLNPTIKTTTVEAIKQVELPYPILERIAKAESYNSHFCTKEIVAKAGCHKYEIGSVLIHVNNNGTYDIGKFAINSTHLSEALALGYNVYEENDNFEFAKYLFRNQGSEPWSASKLNWNK